MFATGGGLVPPLADGLAPPENRTALAQAGLPWPCLHTAGEVELAEAVTGASRDIQHAGFGLGGLLATPCYLLQRFWLWKLFRELCEPASITVRISSAVIPRLSMSCLRAASTSALRISCQNTMTMDTIPQSKPPATATRPITCPGLKLE